MKQKYLFMIGMTAALSLTGCQSGSTNAETEALQEQITQLQQQITELEQQASADTADAPSAKQSEEGTAAAPEGLARTPVNNYPNKRSNKKREHGKQQAVKYNPYNFTGAPDFYRCLSRICIVGINAAVIFVCRFVLHSALPPCCAVRFNTMEIFPPSEPIKVSP